MKREGGEGDYYTGSHRYLEPTQPRSGIKVCRGEREGYMVLLNLLNLTHGWEGGEKGLLHRFT